MYRRCVSLLNTQTYGYLLARVVLHIEMASRTCSGTTESIDPPTNVGRRANESLHSSSTTLVHQAPSSPDPPTTVGRRTNEIICVHTAVVWHLRLSLFFARAQPQRQAGCAWGHHGSDTRDPSSADRQAQVDRRVAGGNCPRQPGERERARQKRDSRVWARE